MTDIFRFCVFLMRSFFELHIVAREYMTCAVLIPIPPNSVWLYNRNSYVVTNFHYNNTGARHNFRSVCIRCRFPRFPFLLSVAFISNHNCLFISWRIYYYHTFQIKWNYIRVQNVRFYGSFMIISRLKISHFVCIHAHQ